MSSNTNRAMMPYRRTVADRFLYALYWFCYGFRFVLVLVVLGAVGNPLRGKDQALSVGLAIGIALLALLVHFLMAYIAYNVFSAANCLRLGTFFAEHGKWPYTQACLLFDRATELCNTMTAAYVNRAACLLRVGPANYDRAEQDIQTAIRQAPDWSRPYYVCGCLAEARGQLARAVECYSKALSLREGAISGPPIRSFREKWDFIGDFGLKHVSPEVVKLALEKCRRQIESGGTCASGIEINANTD